MLRLTNCSSMLMNETL